jgi:hypothetical protein
MHEIPFPRPKLDLHRLPVFEPDPALWSRIAAAHGRRRRVRQWSFAAAATVLLGIAAALLVQPAPPAGPSWADAQRESQALEAQWRQLADGGRPVAVGLTRLRSIDAALQAAYDRGAEATELEPLWKQRNDALRGLIARFQDASAYDATRVTRI